MRGHKNPKKRRRNHPPAPKKHQDGPQFSKNRKTSQKIPSPKRNQNGNCSKQKSKQNLSKNFYHKCTENIVPTTKNILTASKTTQLHPNPTEKPSKTTESKAKLITSIFIEINWSIWTQSHHKLSTFKLTWSRQNAVTLQTPSTKKKILISAIAAGIWSTLMNLSSAMTSSAKNSPSWAAEFHSISNLYSFASGWCSWFFQFREYITYIRIWPEKIAPKTVFAIITHWCWRLLEIEILFTIRPSWIWLWIISPYLLSPSCL